MKPDDIPQWAWDKARHTFAELLTPFRYEDKEAFADAEHIARAILAAVEEEREACAEEMDRRAIENANTDDTQAAYRNAASAIRNRS